MNRGVSNKELRRAARQVEERMLAALAQDELGHREFSPIFRLKMEPVLTQARRLERRSRVIQTITASIAIIFICGFSWLATHAQARDTVQRWIRETWRNSIVYRFMGEENSPLPEVRPAWLPEGYEETKTLDRGNWLSVRYQNASGDYIFFDVQQMHDGAAIDLIPNACETYSSESVVIGRLYGDLYISNDKTEQSVLVWMDEEAGVCFTISATLQPSVILHIAESVRLVNSTKSRNLPKNN